MDQYLKKYAEKVITGQFINDMNNFNKIILDNSECHFQILQVHIRSISKNYDLH